MHQNAQEEVVHVVAQEVVHQIVPKTDLDHRVEHHHEEVDLAHESPVHVQEVAVEALHHVDLNAHVVEADVDQDPENLVPDQGNK